MLCARASLTMTSLSFSDIDAPNQLLPDFRALLFPARAPRFHPRFLNLDLPQPLQNLFDLDSNLFNLLLSLDFARVFTSLI